MQSFKMKWLFTGSLYKSWSLCTTCLHDTKVNNSAVKLKSKSDQTYWHTSVYFWVAQYRQQMTFCWPYSIQQAASLKCQVKQVKRGGSTGPLRAMSGHLLFTSAYFQREKSMDCEAPGIQHPLSTVCLLILLRIALAWLHWAMSSVYTPERLTLGMSGKIFQQCLTMAPVRERQCGKRITSECKWAHCSQG